MASIRRTASLPLLRLRSDAQLLAAFRAGREDGFRLLHDRYEKRLQSYARRMLRSADDAEDVVQDVFLRAYSAWRGDTRDVAVRAWLYRVAHNRCVDMARRPAPVPAEPDERQAGGRDPVAEIARRDDLRELVEDVRALPAQQRSALIIRELEGLSYEELAAALDTTVPSVKSLLVRARTGLASAAEAREADCVAIRGKIAAGASSGRGGRPPRIVTDHVRRCTGCRAFRTSLRRRAAAHAVLPAPSG